MAVASSVGYGAVLWSKDYWFPALATTPQSPSGSMTGHIAYAEAMQVSAGAGSINQVRLTSGGTGALSEARSFPGIGWAYRISTTNALSSLIHSFHSYWTPVLLAANQIGPIDDPIGWLRLWIRCFGLAGTIDDATGLSIVPEDGTGTSSTILPKVRGGIGIYRRVTGTPGPDFMRYSSYGAGGALLETIPLAAAADTWHTADFIFRQATATADAWLTFRWDSVDVFTERRFGDPLLFAPQSFSANAVGWVLNACSEGGVGGSGSIDYRWRWRQGPFHPDGYPVAG